MTLKDVVGETKSLLRWGGFIVGALLFIFVLTKIGTSVKERIFPTPKAPPTVAFGKLPKVIFPKTQTPKLTYLVDTLSGVLPTFSDRVKVYPIIRPKPALLALEKTRTRVSRLGFNTQGIPLSQDTYQWLGENSSSKLTINIFSSDFTFSSTFLSKPESQTFFNASDQESFFTIAATFLETLSLLPNDDIDLTKTKTSFFTIENGKLFPATRITRAKIAKVDFFQKNIDNLPILYPNSSTMSLLLGKEQNQIRVVEGGFLHQLISKENSTYPIKTGDKAFEELKLGLAYIDSNPENLSNIRIKEVTLGYFLGDKRQDYLLPIFIFQGDKDFLAFVPAIKDEWVNK